MHRAIGEVLHGLRPIRRLRANARVVRRKMKLDRLNPPWLANARGRSIEATVGTFSGTFPIVRGNNYGVKASVWAAVGPLDDEFYDHGVLADVEFSLRCWPRGIEVVGIPTAIVHYLYRQEASALWRQGWNYGSHRPLIAKMHLEAGKPGPPRFAGWKSWVMLVVTVPMMVTRHGRARWLWTAGNRFGQVAGSTRYRTLML